MMYFILFYVPILQGKLLDFLESLELWPTLTLPQAQAAKSMCLTGVLGLHSRSHLSPYPMIIAISFINSLVYNHKRPVVMMTDGHSSHFDVDILWFCHEKQIYQFLSPPDTTGLLQTKSRAYHTGHIYDQSKSVNRETFMLMLAEVWPLKGTSIP